MIAWIDISKNDVDIPDLVQLPAVYWYRKGPNKDYVELKELASVEAIQEWIQGRTEFEWVQPIDLNEPEQPEL